jgi:large subunit ribosomal protein L23
VKITSVIRRPVVTEKSTLARERTNVVVFEVAIGATKIDVKRAVEKLFDTQVADVRTYIAHGKVKRQGRFMGRRPDWKKAIVRLKDGAKVPDFVQGA